MTLAPGILLTVNVIPTNKLQAFGKLIVLYGCCALTIFNKNIQCSVQRDSVSA
jgi:hypothetical protein